MAYLFEPVDNGSRLSYICSWPHGPFPLRKINDLGAGRVLSGRNNKSFAAFRAYIDKEITAALVSVDPATGLAEDALEQTVTDCMAP